MLLLFFTLYNISWICRCLISNFHVSSEILTSPNHVHGSVKGLLSTITPLKLRVGVLPICNITFPSSSILTITPLSMVGDLSPTVNLNPVEEITFNFDISLVLSKATITLHSLIKLALGLNSYNVILNLWN